MAYGNNDSQTGSKSNERKAIAFGNIEFTQLAKKGNKEGIKEGKEIGKFQLAQGAPIYPQAMNRQYERSLINKAKALAEAGLPPLQIQVTMTIHLVKDDSQLPDIEL